MAKWLVGGISVPQKLYEQAEVSCQNLVDSKDKTAKDALYHLYSKVNDQQDRIQGRYREMLRSFLDKDGNILDKFTVILRKSLVVDGQKDTSLEWCSQVEKNYRSLLDSEDAEENEAAHRLCIKVKNLKYNIEEPYLGILRVRELLDEEGNIDESVHAILEESLVLDPQDENYLQWNSKIARKCKELLSSQNPNYRAAIYELYLKIKDPTYEISSLYMKILGSNGFISGDVKTYGRLHHILRDALVKQDVPVRWMPRAEVNCRYLLSKGGEFKTAVYELGLQLKDPSHSVADGSSVPILLENQLVDKTGRVVKEAFISLEEILVSDSRQQGCVQLLTRDVSRLSVS